MVVGAHLWEVSMYVTGFKKECVSVKICFNIIVVLIKIWVWVNEWVEFSAKGRFKKKKRGIRNLLNFKKKLKGNIIFHTLPREKERKIIIIIQRILFKNKNVTYFRYLYIRDTYVHPLIRKDSSKEYFQLQRSTSCHGALRADLSHHHGACD